jgi:hypothetical protein
MVRAVRQGLVLVALVSGKETIQHRKRGSASLILFYYETTKNGWK